MKELIELISDQIGKIEQEINKLRINNKIAGNLDFSFQEEVIDNQIQMYISFRDNLKDILNLANDLLFPPVKMAIIVKHDENDKLFFGHFKQMPMLGCQAETEEELNNKLLSSLSAYVKNMKIQKIELVKETQE